MEDDEIGYFKKLGY